MLSVVAAVEKRVIGKHKCSQQSQGKYDAVHDVYLLKGAYAAAVSAVNDGGGGARLGEAPGVMAVVSDKLPPPALGRRRGPTPRRGFRHLRPPLQLIRKYQRPLGA